MATKYHIASRGVNAGQLVPCYAKTCRNNVEVGVDQKQMDAFFNAAQKLTQYTPDGRKELAKETEDADLLNLLAVDRDENVRFAAAGSFYLPETAQAMLANDKDEDIASKLAQNHTISESTYIKLLNRKSTHKQQIEFWIINNRGMTPQLLQKLKPHFSRVGQDFITVDTETTPAAALDELIHKENLHTQIHRQAALHPNLSGEGMKFLSDRADDTVRENLATREDLPQDILLGLLIDYNKDVRTNAYNNPSCPEDYKAAAILAGGVN